MADASSFTHVLHASTECTIGPSLTPLQRYYQIVDGTRNILDLATAKGALRILLTSSGAIYDPQPADLAAIPEDWPGSPHLAEHLYALMSEQHGLATVVARLRILGQPDPGVARNRYVPDIYKAQQQLGLSYGSGWAKSGPAARLNRESGCALP